MTNTNISIKKGNQMKKTMFVAALAAVMILAFAAPAFANWGGWSGSSLYDTAPGTPRHSSSYVMWDDVVSLGTSGTAGTPHKGYTDSSTLCAVCHSVHYAPVFDGQFTSTTTGAWAPSGTGGFANASDLVGTQAQLLLRSKAGTACNFCHIDTAIGGVVVYAGQADIFGYVQNFTSSYAHDYHQAGCNDCHSVHGANTYRGPLASAILRQTPRDATRVPQREIVTALTSSNSAVPALFDTLADVYAGTAIGGGTDRYVQQTAFCSSCHYVYSDSSANAVKERGGTASFAKHHPMAQAAPGVPSNATVTAKGGSDNARLQWAWVGSATCRSCHAAGLDSTYVGDKTTTAYSENSFPHYTKDKYRFLEQDSAAEYVTDQVCLDCHRNGDASAGVGETF
jgi:hypothetical protein